MLISFLSLVALANLLLGQLGGLVRVHLSLETILGWAFVPLALVMGVPWKDAVDGRQPARHAHGAERADRLLAARRDQGDASTRAPSRSPPTPCAASPTSARSASRSAASARSPPSAADDLARLGLRALLAGTFANFMTACIAGCPAVSTLLQRLDEAVALRPLAQPALAARSRRGARLRPGRFRGRARGADGHPVRRDPALPRLDRGRATAARSCSAAAERRRRSPVHEGPRAPLRGLPARGRRLPGARARPPRREDARADERRRRDQHRASRRAT